MIVRTYGRRNRTMTRSYSNSAFNDAVSDGFEDSLSQESPQDIFNFNFSSQDSSHWGFDSDPYGSNSSQESPQLENGDGVFRKSKKAKKGKREIEVGSKKLKSKGPTNTVTLMETQEIGEMMEHTDEVNFALDGLKKGQPVRIRRASLLSMLSISGTAQQRRILRTHGTAKTIIDAILGLSFDDSPSNLAAAALFYILTSDGQGDHLLDSPSCIRFLIKLLKPVTSDATKDKALTIGSKLLALRKDATILQDSKGLDSTSAAIMIKVQEILVSCKDMKSRDGNDNGMEKLELSPKWISLLTMEKACLSTISLEDTSGSVQKIGGNFKEKLREHGGLDAVFEVTRNCHSIMEGWLEQHSSSILESKNTVNLESLVLLLKCLKIMENATFLSMDNQSHLLGIKENFNCQSSPRFFTKLILSVIKILSGVSLLISSISADDEKFCSLSNGTGTGHSSEIALMANDKVDSNEILSIDSSVRCCSLDWTSSQKSFNVSHNSRWKSADQSGISKSGSETTTSVADTRLLKMRVNSSTSGSCSGTSRTSNSGKHVINSGSRINLAFGKRPKVIEETKSDLLEDSRDPFAFDEDEFEPSKWDILYGRPKVSQTQKRRAPVGEQEDGCQLILMLSQQETSNMENHHSSEASCSFAVDEEKSNLLADCLLTAVKVLMNLTNDNPVGCQQIAACGGLETLSSLIAGHFPSFGSYLPPFRELRENSLWSKSDVEVGHRNDKHLSDQELDFLVAILGLLVNLVEKDGRNRLRLAATSVSVPSLEGIENQGRDVISLLCSIFLANQGAGEAAGEGKHLSLDDEDAVAQGEREAEKMIIEAYSALLLAFLSTESKSIRNAIAECLPDHKLAILVPVLERFVEFHSTLNMISPETHTMVLEVIESCRVP